MDTKNANFEFNERSGANREKLKPADRDHQDQIRQANAAEAKQHETDYERDRLQRIATYEQTLTQHYTMQLNMPRPPNAPDPTMPTAEEIHQQARDGVEKAHIQGRDEMMFRHKTMDEDHTRESLGHPARDPSQYEAEKAAYLDRLSQRRQQQTPEHDPGSQERER